MNQASPLGVSEPLTILECPKCGYCLTGLPGRHNCPECGFRYDYDTRAWSVTKWGAYLRIWVLLLAISVAGLLMGSTKPAVMRMRYVDVPYAKSMFIICALSFSVVGTLGRLRSLGARPFVAVTDEGVHYRVQGVAERILRWNEIESVRIVIRKWRRRVFIHEKNGQAVNLTPVVRSAYDVACFERAVRGAITNA